jgi:hypothetical protein
VPEQRANLYDVTGLINLHPACTALAAAALLVSVADAHAQRLVDLEVRASAGPDVLTTGAAAAFWNPAAAGRLGGRAEALVIDIRGPAVTGLGGFAAAGAWRLDSRLTLAVSWEHVSVDDIGRTSDSPIPDGAASRIELGEDVVGLSAAQRLGHIASLGVQVRYARASAIVEDRTVLEFGVGLDLRPDLPLRPAVAGMVRAEEGGARWGAGLEVVPVTVGGISAGAAWGLGGGPSYRGTSQRLAGLFGWRDALHVSAGLAAEPGADGTTWQPIAAAALRVQRYGIGVVREELPHGFGAKHAFRFSVAF